MRFNKFLVLFTLLIIPLFIKAENIFEYFSYSPRSSYKLDLNLVKEVKQEFKVFDDNISKIYIWLDNPDLDNNIEIRLYKKENLLFSKILKISKIKGGFYGYKFPIDLGTNVKIKSGEEYSLLIKNLDNNTIFIYYLDKIQLLQTTEEKGVIPAQLGKFYIKDNEYPYYLKIALAEGLEKDVPIVVNPQIEIKNPYKVYILFNANEPIKYKLVYWDVIKNETFVISETSYLEDCFEEIKKCKIILYTNQNTFYKFQLSIIDYWENFTTYEGEFITPIDPTISTSTISTSTIKINDNTPPKIINFQIQEITNNNIAVTFQTDEYSLSGMKIFYKETGTIVMEILNNMFNLYHKIDTLNLLFPDLEYEAIVYVEDIFKNKYEHKFNFKTLKGGVKQSLFQFLSQPQIVQIKKMDEITYNELTVPNIQISYNQDSNKIYIKTDSKDLKCDLVKKPDGSIFSYTIKEGGYEIDLNILSPGAYTYLAYQNLRSNVKKILKMGEIEIKQTPSTLLNISSKDNKVNLEKSPNKLIKVPTQTIITQTGKSLFYKKFLIILGFVIISILFILLLKIKRK